MQRLSSRRVAYASLLFMDNDTAIAEAFSALLKTVRELRQMCPWDRDQTNASLAKYLIEEAYEALDAIERDDMASLADELGDLLAQIISQAVIAELRASFTLDDLIRAATQKLLHRHPHVYGDVSADTPEQVVRNWSDLKQRERSAAGLSSALDGIGALPALMYAEKLGERARAAGMDWPDIAAVLAKVEEELAEARRALQRGSQSEVLVELGDMMLALANAPRFLNASAEQTLRRASHKFAERFRKMERLAAAGNLQIQSLTAAEIDRLWEAAKQEPQP